MRSRNRSGQSPFGVITSIKCVVMTKAFIDLILALLVECLGGFKVTA